MTKENLAIYYVVYHSIIRLSNFLEENDISIPDNIKNEIKNFEKFLIKESVDVTKLNKLIEKSVKDEQDLGFKEMLYQQYLYALSDFSYFFTENNIDFLHGSLDTIMETYRFFAMNRYLEENNISSMIWNEDDESMIEKSDLIVNEKQKQLDDSKYATINL